MRRGLALLSLAFFSTACGGASVERTDAAERGIEVRLEAEASVSDLALALRRALESRGHEGECFLAWDAARTDVTVRVGDRERSAALSCGGLAALSGELEGRCPGGRAIWVADAEVALMSLVFGAPGDAFAGPPVGMAGAGAPATDAVFFPSEGGRLVLALEVAREPAHRELDARVAPRSAKSRAKQAPSASLLEDPQIQLALQQLVARVQRCNPSGEGSLVLEWLALPDGTVTSARPLTSSVGEEIVGCALDMANASRLPAREGEPIGYCAPVLLAPALRPGR